MKRLFPLILLLSVFGGLSLQAQQRVGYVNTSEILGQMEEYEAAVKEVDRIAEEWRREVNTKRVEIENMYRELQNDRPLLTNEQVELRIQKIEGNEKSLQDYQKQKFGYDGELFQKRQELIKPIQDKVYNAIEQYAKDRRYDFIFDQSNSTTMLYANPERNLNEDILKNLGITN